MDGRRGGGAVPLTAKSIADIRDNTVREMKQREVALRAKLATLRTELRTSQVEKESAVRKAQQPGVPNSALDKLDADFQKLLAERDEWTHKLDALRLEQSTLSRARDELRSLDFDGDDAIRALRKGEAAVKAAKDDVNAASDERNAVMVGLAFKTASDADAEIARIEGRIAAATKKSDNSVVRELQKQKTAAERAKKQVLWSYAADEDVIRLTEALHEAEAALTDQQNKKRDIDAKKVELRERMAQMRNFNQEFDEVHSRLRTVRKKMDDNKEAKRRTQAKLAKESTENSTVTNAQSKLKELMLQRDGITAELDEITRKLPTAEVVFTPDLRQEILGHGGATLAQLRTDFGVAIDFTPEKTNSLTIVGAQEDCEATKQAFDQMLKNLALARMTATVKFDPSIGPSLIGSRGSNVERIQNISGAKVRVSASDGTATIVGTQEAVDAAKALVEQHVSNSASMSLPFDRDLRDVIFGKGGATVRAIEEESGAKKVRVDRDHSLITAFGTQEAVDKVKAFYTDLIATYKRGAFVMRVDPRQTGMIVGRGGATIQEIQSLTGAVVNVNESGKVSIHGSQDAVQAARQQIEDIIHREEIKIPFNKALYDYLVSRPVVAAAPEADAEEPEATDVSKAAPPKEKNSPLEEVKYRTDCDRVTAYRYEGCVIVRGRKENVAAAKQLIEELLEREKPHTVVVAFPAALSAYLTRRDTETKHTPLDTVQNSNPGILGIDLDRDRAQLTVSGKEDAVKAGAAQFGALFDGLQDQLASVTVPLHTVGAVIGNRGSIVSDLQRRYNADVKVSRETGVCQAFCAEGKEKLDAILADIVAISEGKNPVPKDAPAAATA